jgi:tRNA(fMet)-specific endonuclease VapC
MILFDTDTCIELLRGNERILQRRDRYDGIVGISFMSIAELYYGAEKSKDPSRNMDIVDNLLLSLEIIQTEIPILRRFGLIKANLQKQGVIVADADILIAATTLERAERLITANSRHFERIPGLVTEDWR